MIITATDLGLGIDGTTVTTSNFIFYRVEYCDVSATAIAYGAVDGALKVTGLTKLLDPPPVGTTRIIKFISLENDSSTTAERCIVYIGDATTLHAVLFDSIMPTAAFWNYIDGLGWVKPAF